MSFNRINKQIINSSGSWTAPAGVTKVIVLGMGGGASGTTGASGRTVAPLFGGNGGNGGLSVTLIPIYLTVVPNTTYTITIGAGGVESLGRSGGDSSFGSLVVFYGAKSSSIETPTTTRNAGYFSSYNVIAYTINRDYSSSTPVSPNSDSGSGNVDSPYASYTGFRAARGINYQTPPLFQGGVGGVGGCSGEGIGGIGGNGGEYGVSNATNGGNAAPNSGAGGGAGGGGRSDANPANTLGGAGGNGGSGQIIVMWVE